MQNYDLKERQKDAADKKRLDRILNFIAILGVVALVCILFHDKG
jgi:hypothetical protein